MRWWWWFALCGSALLPLFFPIALAPLVDWTVTYPWPAASSLASAAAIICWQYRPSIQLQFSSGWLSALPISTRQQTLWEAVRTARVLILVVPLLITTLSTHRDQLALLLLSVVIGSALGFALAGRAIQQRSAPPPDGRRLPIAGSGRSAIAKLPLAWAAARLSGKKMAPWLAVTLGLIPGGIGGGPSMLLVAVTVLSLALVWLVAGAWRHLFLMAAWLATTPMSRGTFARLTLLRVSVWFFGVLAMLLAVLAALQMPMQAVIFIAAFVLACVVVCFSAAFRHRFNAVRARRSVLLIVPGICVFLLVVPVLWLALVAPMIALWQLRQVRP